MSVSSRTCVVGCVVALMASACSSPEVSLGRTRGNVSGENGNASTGSSENSTSDPATTEPADAAPGTPSTAASSPASGDTAMGTAAPGTCGHPLEMPSNDDSWLEFTWKKDSPALPTTLCGSNTDGTNTNPPTAPAVVLRWVAPHDGDYSVLGWTRDFYGAIAGGLMTCGDDSKGGCALVAPQDLPAVPFSTSEHPGDGFSPIIAKAGQAFLIWFEAYDPDHPAPDEGTAIVNINTKSLWPTPPTN